jgi:hypothetical protein
MNEQKPEKNDCDVSEAKKEYLKILLQQYSEVWESIRNDSNAVWQIPTLLLATISVLGIAYIQLYQIPHAQPCLIQIGRISILLVGLGFTLVSFIALTKHRLSCNYRTADFIIIQEQLKTVLGQKEFDSLFQRNEKEGTKDKKLEFREVNFASDYMANAENYEGIQKVFKGKNYKKEHFLCCKLWFYRRSAYRWQQFLTFLILVGVVVALIIISAS